MERSDPSSFFSLAGSSISPTESLTGQLVQHAVLEVVREARSERLGLSVSDQDHPVSAG